MSQVNEDCRDPGWGKDQYDRCRNHCHRPAPFTYSVWQKGYSHPFPLTVGLKPSHFFVIMFIYLKAVLDDTLCQ